MFTFLYKTGIASLSNRFLKLRQPWASRSSFFFRTVEVLLSERNELQSRNTSDYDECRRNTRIDLISSL